MNSRIPGTVIKQSCFRPCFKIFDLTMRYFSPPTPPLPVGNLRSSPAAGGFSLYPFFFSVLYPVFRSFLSSRDAFNPWRRASPVTESRLDPVVVVWFSGVEVRLERTWLSRGRRFRMKYFIIKRYIFQLKNEVFFFFSLNFIKWEKAQQRRSLKFYKRDQQKPNKRVQIT